MDYKTIIYEKNENGVALITLNRPEKLNALDLLMSWEIREVLKEIGNNKKVKSVIFTGKGRAFSSGMDLNLEMDLPTEATINLDDISMKSLTLDLFDLDKPTIAAVNGIAVGAGWNFAQICDLVYVSENATMGYSFVKRAIVPEFGSTYLLPRSVGIHKAKELMFFGDMFDAKKALELGLVNKVLPAEELMPEVMRKAEQLARAPSLSLKLMKKIMNSQIRENISHALDLENEGLYETMSSADFFESIIAFNEKRKTRFG